MAATDGCNAARNCVMCFKHYLSNIICYNYGVYLEDKMAKRTCFDHFVCSYRITYGHKTLGDIGSRTEQWQCLPVERGY